MIEKIGVVQESSKLNIQSSQYRNHVIVLEPSKKENFVVRYYDLCKDDG